MTDLQQRVDGWLDADLGPVGSPDDAATARARDAVRGAVTRGRRLRTRRRALAAGSTAAGLIAAATVGVLVLGSGSVTTTPRPPASRTPSGPSASPLPSASASASADQVRAGVRPIAVRYPTANGAVTVTWPAPAGGRPWRVKNAEWLERDRTGIELWRSVAPAVGADPAAADGDPGVSVWGVGGVPMTFLLLFPSFVDTGAGLGAGDVSVFVSRGALPDDDLPVDRCGAWPDGVPGLGVVRPEHPERCALVSGVDAQGRDLQLVHHETPATPSDGPSRSVFTVRSDGLLVAVSFRTSPGATELPPFAALDRVARTVQLPTGPAATGGATDVRYRVGGLDRTIRWPAPASGLPWAVDDPSVAPGENAGPATDGARDLAAALAVALPGTGLGGTRVTPPDAAVTGTVGGRPTAYLARVRTAGTAPSEWTVRATRGGVTTRPVGYDLCGNWLAGWARGGEAVLGTADLGMSPAEQSVWFEGAGWPRVCSIVERNGATVVHLSVPSTRPDTGARTPAQAYAFTVRPDGTAFAAQVVAPVGADPADYVDRLDRLVLGLPYPGRP